MATDRLETAVKDFQHVNQMVERYTRLCRAYVNLSERFHQLDVDHMTLKGQMVPLLKALKAHQARLRAVEAEKASLQTALEEQEARHRQELQQITTTYEDQLQALHHHVTELQPLAQLLNGDTHHELSVAEEQMELVETTLREIEQDSSPDLSTDEKALLAAYQADPDSFMVAAAAGDFDSEAETKEPVASLWHYYYDEKTPEAAEP
jgi:uncharacterized phage infection (PIP) family protein YhgE